MLDVNFHLVYYRMKGTFCIFYEKVSEDDETESCKHEIVITIYNNLTFSWHSCGIIENSKHREFDMRNSKKNNTDIQSCGELSGKWKNMSNLPYRLKLVWGQ